MGNLSCCPPAEQHYSFFSLFFFVGRNFADWMIGLYPQIGLEPGSAHYLDGTIKELFLVSML
jgi:hypothetical protein